MKILVIIPSYKPAYTYGGPIRAVSALSEVLAKSGHDVSVYTTSANGADELDVITGKEYIVDGVKVTYFPRMTKGHSTLSPQLLSAFYINASKFNIIHIQSWWNLISVPVAWICIKKDILPVISPRGTLTNFTFTHNRVFVKKWLHSFIGKSLLEKSVLLFSSTREKEEAKKYITPKFDYIIPNLLELPSKRYGNYREEEYLKVIYLGRIDPAKNIELLLEVFQSIIDTPMHLQIVGAGDQAYTRELKEKSCDLSSLEWLGSVDGEEKYKLLAEADVLVLPSHTENFGNVVLESLSQGTPVMVSENVGAKDYVLNNNLGWVVSGGVKNWKAAFRTVWLEREKNTSIRQRAFDCIRRDYLEKNQEQAYIEIYQNHSKSLN